MHWIDWMIVILPLLIVAYIALRTQRYVKGVADFLAAGRVAGRYVVAVASGEAGMGLISLVAMFEMYYKSGFAFGFWGTLTTPIFLILGLTGYCIYRFRETRAMTMGQFFEIRYSRKFRIFAATLQSISGVINYAIFPAVGARFLIYFCGLPLHVNIFGLSFPTFGLVMAIFLSVAVTIVTLGGQITIMVTDCIQGILSYPMYVVIVIYVFYKFSWFNEMAPALLNRPPGQSMLNPFDIDKLRDFNLFYVFVGIVSGFLNRMSWAGTQGYNAAAATPHEQKMGQVLGSWRGGFSYLMYILLAVVGFTFMTHAHFAKPAKEVRAQLAWKAVNDVAGESQFTEVRKEINGYLKTGKISPSLQAKLVKVRTEEAEDAKKEGASAEDIEKKLHPKDQTISEIVATAIKSEDKSKAQTFGTIFGQMRVPMALKAIFPVGVTGVFCALMIFLLISTDTTYLHSWGSIIVQDVVLPFRNKPFTPHQQLFWLRTVIASVAVFAFLFSFFFGQVDYIMMFFIITGAIWLGGAGPCIVGGMYWKRGTAAGAWAALSSGSILAVTGFVAQNNWVKYIYPYLAKHDMLGTVTKIIEGASNPFRPYIDWHVTPDKFPINSQEIYFIAMVVSLSLYVGLSLLTSRKKVFNMDRMLHRGKYQVEGKKIEREKLTLGNVFPRLLGIDQQYTRGDKALAWSVFLYSFGWGFGSWVVIVIWNVFFGHWPNHWWANWFFLTNVVIAGAIGIVSTVWFTIGGVWDLNRLFKRLKAKEVNILDDGRVVGHVSAADVALVEDVEHVVIEEAHEQEHILDEEVEEEHREEEKHHKHDEES